MFAKDSGVLPDLQFVRHSSASLTLQRYDKFSATRYQTRECRRTFPFVNWLAALDDFRNWLMREAA